MAVNCEILVPNKRAAHPVMPVAIDATYQRNNWLHTSRRYVQKRTDSVEAHFDLDKTNTPLITLFYVTLQSYGDGRAFGGPLLAGN